jgi:predicted Fe-Mo cluster-binding NifX family protein
MKVIVSSSGDAMDSPVSGVFGRAPYFILVETEDLSHEALSNPAMDQSSGAGIMAAQFVTEQRPEALLSVNIGPKAFEVLKAGSVPCYESGSGTVLEAVQSLGKGELHFLGSANAESHSGSGGRTASASGQEVLEELFDGIEKLRGQVAGLVDRIDHLTEEEE